METATATRHQSQQLVAINSTDVVRKQDLIIGTAIALVMITVFVRLSSGMSLIVTFVPGVVFTWLTYLWLYVTKTKPPTASAFIPVFFALLAVQFLHFAEEFSTGFRTQFPLLYGGAPYGENLFVTFNMLSYFIFTVSCILALTRRHLRFLLVPVLFYIVYGAIGNAISHTWWTLYLHSYFPGFVTAQAYWIGGPLVLYRLLGERKVALAMVIVFALAMVPLLTIFASPSALAAR